MSTPDPGWWRRGMSGRTLVIVVTVAVVIVVGGLVFAAVSGVPIF